MSALSHSIVSRNRVNLALSGSVEGTDCLGCWIRPVRYSAWIGTQAQVVSSRGRDD